MLSSLGVALNYAGMFAQEEIKRHKTLFNSSLGWNFFLQTSVMGLNDENVIAILSQEAWDILMDIVKSGELDPPKMKETARKLHPTIGGGHLQRTGSGGKRASWPELREILSHWYQLELFQHEDYRQWALERLIDIFKSDAVMLPKVAEQFKELLTKQEQG